MPTKCRLLQANILILWVPLYGEQSTESIESNGTVNSGATCLALEASQLPHVYKLDILPILPYVYESFVAFACNLLPWTLQILDYVSRSSKSNVFLKWIPSVHTCGKSARLWSGTFAGIMAHHFAKGFCWFMELVWQDELTCVIFCIENRIESHAVHPQLL